uniref:Uncharacterized protein n=1 Tax=viral metagenome TaxID=1070528 RepID=A0A6C0F6G5_9ZZZZ
MSVQEEIPQEKKIKAPEEFYKIINDFTNDIITTFPEYETIIKRWWTPKDLSHIADPVEKEMALLADKEKRVTFIHKHCMRVFPERFFDILYQNADMFKDESIVNTEFLPGIVFKYLWTMDISDNTRETIWKYLQLILFSAVSSVNNTTEFGDSAKLFESVNEEELKGKLQETLSNIQNLFENQRASGEEGQQPNLGAEGMNVPNAEQIHEHLQGMMQGKLGKIAMEMAEEAAQNLNMDMENAGNAQEVFQKMFKNPGKLMNMVKNLGDKLDTRIKSGEIKESELISEGIDLINKMKNMPGMENMQGMFEKMGIPGLGRNSKVNMGAMENQMKQNLKNAQTRERIKSKLEAKKAADAAEQIAAAARAAAQASQPQMTDDELIAAIGDLNTNSNSTSNKSKSKSKGKNGNKKK